MLREIKSKVDENSTMLKRLVNDTLVSDAAPSSKSSHSEDMKSNLDLPLRSIADVQRLEQELKVAKTREKYVSQQYLNTRKELHGLYMVNIVLEGNPKNIVKT